MKKIPLSTILPVLLFLLSKSANVQAASATSEKDCLDAKGRYQFGQFIKGTVRFRNGAQTAAFVNYYYPDGQMRFLNSKGDTLIFTGKYLIDRIEADGRVFILTPAFDMEVIGGSGSYRLAVAVKPKARGSRLDHSGQQFSASSANIVPAGLMVTNQDGQFQWQNNDAGHGWQMKPTFFLIDQNGIIHQASRQRFVKVFTRYRRQVSHYIRDNRIDFHRENDLQKLLVFCAQLTAS